MAGGRFSDWMRDRWDGTKDFFHGMGGKLKGPKGIKTVLLAIGIAISALLYFMGSWLFAILLFVLIILILVFSSEYLKAHDGVKLLLILGIAAVCLLIFLPMIGQNINIINPKALNKIIDFNAISQSNFVDFWKNLHLLKSWNAFWNRQIAVATGGYFEGQVEQSNEDTKIGIYLEDIKSSDPLLVEGEDAVFWVKIKGKAINEPINVTLDCSGISSGKEKVKNENEAKKITIFSYEVDSYDCEFKNLKAGTLKVNFTAEYTFKTLGYTKAYFISQEKLRELWRQETDPLDEFGISDKDPIAVYTNGPVKIGMGMTMEPVAIKKDTDELSMFGVTIENRWLGHVKEVKNVEIQVPKSMTLPKCDHSMAQGDPSNCIKRCDGIEECIKDCEEYNFYFLDEAGKKRINQDMNSMTSFQTINCYLHGSSEADILGDSPLSTKYFRTIVDYVYVSELSKTFNVRKLPATAQ